ncbi:helix-turn-helix transcriptional regulator [Paenibacillus donghaensis]|uniref:AraC family transcriptional regulator n=1 Tax=Paenibacillus donghaensis TaxID=414771 RepID=A0A2Z2KJL1_9BACL|nr:helix-turn-helix domain-containing protein [Paenibacillus donghaensis]ASA23480.1 AraC family transcriptional regulator [Paenibacillus donghaensis]
MMYRQYFLPSFEEFNFFCFPHSVGKYTRPDNHNVTRTGGVRDFSIHFVVEGKGYIELGDNLYTLKQGDLFFHRPFEDMRYYTSENEPWEIYWMQFNGSGLSDFLLERGFHESSLWYMKDLKMLEQAYIELLDEMELHNFLRPPKISALTYAVLIEFVSNAIAFTNKRGTQNVDKIIEILPIMQKAAHSPFELEEWAAKVNLTPNYFCSLFKKVTRVTPLAYITKCRIQNSKQLLLENPDMAIKEVAISSGYPSVSYYNKIFMQLEGMTPTEFRTVHFK